MNKIEVAIEAIENNINTLYNELKHTKNKKRIEDIEYSIFRFTRAKNDLQEALNIRGIR